MRGILLAGGTGSRLQPLTRTVNKHLLPVGRHPMIHYPLHALLDAGIRDILLVTGPEHVGAFARHLGSGGSVGATFTYRAQDAPGGIADALTLARDFARGERSVVLLGDNVFCQSLRRFVASFARQARGARVLLHPVDDPSRFGVPAFAGERLIRIDEKPAQPASTFAVTGVYMYDEDVFDRIADLRPSLRGELEITDVNNRYIAEGSLAWDVLEGWWSDAGTFASLRRANELAAGVDLPLLAPLANSPAPA